MKLILRHIKKSVLRTPLQSIIIFITVFFSSLIFVCSPAIFTAVTDEKELRTSLKYGQSDIVLSSSESRYLESEKISELLGGEYGVYGTLTLALNRGDDTLTCVATELETVSDCFDFSFTFIQSVSQKELSSCIFISDAMAKRYSLKVGDSITLGLLGSDKSYTVKGINEHRFFDTYDILMSSEGARDTLVTLSPVFIAFNELPCNNIYIKVPNNNVQGAVKTLEPFLKENGITYTESRGASQDYIYTIIVLWLVCSMLFSAIVAVILLSFPLDILSRRRDAEMQPFIISGAPKKTVITALLLERGFYTIFGAALAIAVSPLFLKLIGSGFTSSEILPSVKDALICLGAQVIIGGALMLKKPLASRASKRSSIISKAVLAAVFTVLVTFSALADENLRCFFAIPAVPLAILMLFAVVRPIFVGIAKLFGNLVFKMRGCFASALSLSAKNNSRLPEIHDVGKILASMLSVACILITSVGFFEQRIDRAYSHYDCDSIVLSAEEGIAEKALSVDGTVACSYAFLGEGSLKNNSSIILSSVENTDFVSKNIAKNYPNGNEILLSRQLAELNGVKIGEELTVTVHNQPMKFVLSGYCEDNSQFAVFSASGCGIPYNLTLIRHEKGTDTAYTKNLTSALAVYGAPVQDAAALMNSQIYFAQVACSLITNYVGALIIMIAFGSVNLIIVCYLRRKNEFSAFKTVGMKRSEVSLMIILEFTLTLLCVALLSFIGYFTLHHLVSLTMNSFGFGLL